MARPLVAQQQRIAEIFSNAYAFKSTYGRESGESV